MKIIENIRNKKTDFCNISAGAIFKYKDVYLMKIMEIEDTNEDIFNAINLEIGDCYCFQPCDKVEVIDAELIIK